MNLKRVIISIIWMASFATFSHGDNSVEKRMGEIIKLADSGCPIETVSEFYKVIDECSTEDDQTYCYGKGIEICKRFMKEYANDKQVMENTLYLLADSYWNLKDYSNGLRVCEDFLTRYSNSKDVKYIFTLKGKCLYMMKKYREALKIFQALESSSNLEKEWLLAAQFGIGMCYYCLQLYDSAITQCQKFINNYPDHVWCKDALIIIGDSYIYKKNYEQALKNYMLIRKYPHNKEQVAKAQERIKWIYRYQYKCIYVPHRNWLSWGILLGTILSYIGALVNYRKTNRKSYLFSSWALLLIFFAESVNYIEVLLTGGLKMLLISGLNWMSIKFNLLFLIIKILLIFFAIKFIWLGGKYRKEERKMAKNMGTETLLPNHGDTLPNHIDFK